MNIRNKLLGLIAAMYIVCGLDTFVSCGVYNEISVNSDSSINFYNYKTFAWLHDNLDTANSPYNNEIVRNNLKNYFSRSLIEKGYTLKQDTPDVLLQIVIVNINKEKSIAYKVYPRQYYYCQYYLCSDYFSPRPFDYYYDHYNTFCYATGYCKEKIEYTEASIKLKMIDRKENKLIWECSAKGDIYDQAYFNKNIHPVAIKILKKFPVKL